MYISDSFLIFLKKKTHTQFKSLHKPLHMVGFKFLNSYTFYVFTSHFQINRFLRYINIELRSLNCPHCCISNRSWLINTQSYQHCLFMCNIKNCMIIIVCFVMSCAQRLVYLSADNLSIYFESIQIVFFFF